MRLSSPSCAIVFVSSGLFTCCLLKHVIERKIKGWIEVTRRERRRRKQLLAEVTETRGYCESNDEALDSPLGELAFGRSC